MNEDFHNILSEYHESNSEIPKLYSACYFEPNMNDPGSIFIFSGFCY